LCTFFQSWDECKPNEPCSSLAEGSPWRHNDPVFEKHVRHRDIVVDLDPEIQARSGGNYVQPRIDESLREDASLFGEYSSSLRRMGIVGPRCNGSSLDEVRLCRACG
jgi:hypothetical protein